MLTNLTSYTAEGYRALNINAFSNTPTRSSTGNPDSRASISLGGWVGTDLIAFTVTDSVNASAGVTINTTTGYVDVNIIPDSSPNVVVTYWTVDMGSGAKSTDWNISFAVEANNTNTGKWVFVKGKSTEPKPR